MGSGALRGWGARPVDDLIEHRLKYGCMEICQIDVNEVLEVGDKAERQLRTVGGDLHLGVDGTHVLDGPGAGIAREAMAVPVIRLGRRRRFERPLLES